MLGGPGDEHYGNYAKRHFAHVLSWKRIVGHNSSIYTENGTHLHIKEQLLPMYFSVAAGFVGCVLYCGRCLVINPDITYSTGTNTITSNTRWNRKKNPDLYTFMDFSKESEIIDGRTPKI